jgi:hypothetical protein
MIASAEGAGAGQITVTVLKVVIGETGMVSLAKTGSSGSRLGVDKRPSIRRSQDPSVVVLRVVDWEQKRRW